MPMFIFPPYLCKIFPCPHYGGGSSVARSFDTLRSECAMSGMMAHFAGLAALGTRGRINSFPPCPHYGGGRSGRTIASGQRFAFLRAAADAAIADYVCSRCSVARSFATLRAK